MNLSGSPAARARARVVALAGNPNVGKSTVFNALTGLKQHTGNWPGKTVGSARGAFSFGGESYELVDLPGTYSLLAHSPEEEIARDFLCFGSPDAVVVVCDATCLERNLILALQCLEITRRVVVCVNLMDQARSKGVRVDLEKLSALLGVPVVGTAARDRRTLDGLLTAVAGLFDGPEPMSAPPVSYGPAVERALARLAPALAARTGDALSARFLALRLLESDASAGAAGVDSGLGQGLPDGEAFAAALAARGELAAEGLDARALRDHVVRLVVDRAETIGRAAVTNARQDPGAADRKLDRVFSSRALGFPVMLLLLALIFYLTIEGANYPSALLGRALFAVQDRLYALLIGLNVHKFISGAVALGMFRVLAWVVSVMLPPMAIFFPLFTLLEDLGYLPRVAFNLDRCFQRCRACGKQALTMCAVAGGMRTRRKGKFWPRF